MTLPLLLLLPACSHFSASQPLNGVPLVQVGAASEVAVADCMDAAVETLLQRATAASGDPVQTDARGRGSLTRLASGGFVVRFAQVLDPGGNPRFPTITGAFSVSPTGSAVTSWPTGSNQQALGTAVVTFDQGLVNYTDPADGSITTISGGTFTINLASTYAYASTGNWSIVIDAAVALSGAYPLVESVELVNEGTHSAACVGYRHLQLTETRTTSSGSTPVDGLQIVRIIDGNGLPGQPPGVVPGLDPALPTQVTTNWQCTGDTTQLLQIDRASSRTITWDFTASPAASTSTTSLDVLMLSAPTGQAGPLSSAQLLSDDSATSAL
jgi:hypothetical protein